MADFTILLNRGHRRFIDKYVRKRRFGKCEACDKPALLIKYHDVSGNALWHVCEFCYTELQTSEEE